MKKRFILILILATSLQLTAQEYRKYWKDGKLTWNDFQGTHTKNSTTNLAYTLSYHTDKKLLDNVLYFGLFADAYMDKALSFTHPNFRNNANLAYNQVIFNLIEISKRKLQKELMLLDNIYQSSSLLMDTKSQLQKRILDFQEESNNGLMSEITEKWKLITEKELAEIPIFNLPDYKKSNWTYGLYGGLNYGIQAGDFKDIFNNTLALSFGFEFSYHRVLLGLNMSLTNSKLNKDLQDNLLFIPKGEKSTISMFNLTVGYPLYETNKLKIAPFVGYGSTALGETGDKKNKTETTTSTSIFGLNFDFKNRKRVNFTPMLLNIREEGNSYIRAQFFMAKSNFNPNLSGYSFHIGIAYGIEGRFLSKK
ncbi:MAG: hypothetical protein HWD85_11600 [Flavobacteriaceae bacterium]|nr:hypothetical protein [Flavobacteriaceae bacterium]